MATATAGQESSSEEEYSEDDDETMSDQYDARTEPDLDAIPRLPNEIVSMVFEFLYEELSVHPALDYLVEPDLEISRFVFGQLSLVSRTWHAMARPFLARQWKGEDPTTFIAFCDKYNLYDHIRVLSSPSFQHDSHPSAEERIEFDIDWIQLVRKTTKLQKITITTWTDDYLGNDTTRHAKSTTLGAFLDTLKMRRPPPDNARPNHASVTSLALYVGRDDLKCLPKRLRKLFILFPNLHHLSVRSDGVSPPVPSSFAARPLWSSLRHLSLPGVQFGFSENASSHLLHDLASPSAATLRTIKLDRSNFGWVPPSIRLLGSTPFPSLMELSIRAEMLDADFFSLTPNLEKLSIVFGPDFVPSSLTGLSVPPRVTTVSFDAFSMLQAYPILRQICQGIPNLECLHLDEVYREPHNLEVRNLQAVCQANGIVLATAYEQIWTSEFGREEYVEGNEERFNSWLQNDGED